MAQNTVLAAILHLQNSPGFVYRQYNAPDYDACELARRTVVDASTDILNSVHVAVHGSPSPCLYLFLITSAEAVHDAIARVNTYAFDYLQGTEPAFLPLDQLSRPTTTDASTTEIYSLFLDAVRSRAIADIVDTASTLPRHVHRFKDGFIIHRTPAVSDWAAGWEHKLLNRPVVYFHLQIHFACSAGADSPSHLLIHLTPISTPFSNIPINTALRPGSPIILLPYGTPAYFLASYNGPSNALTKLFDDSLRGLGAGRWSLDGQSASSPPFIIGWIRVENKQGEDKGTPFVWPTRLCLSYLPSHHVKPLDPLPELPAALQASPLLSSPTVPAFNDLPSPPSALSHLPSVKALHSFTVSKSKDIRQLAAEVSSYVDVVARDRERERERLKKEREAGSSPKLMRKSAPTPTQPTASSTPKPPQPPPAQQAVVDQIFYPSPPQTTSLPTAPEYIPPKPVQEATQPTFSQPPPPPPAPVQNGDSSQKSFDLFGNANSNWSQTSDSYFSDMDFGMDVDFNNMNSGSNQANNNYTSHESALDFDFTEDDFSFFDQPSKSSTLPKPTSSVLPTPGHDQSRFTPNTSPHKTSTTAPNVARGLEDIHLSGPGPPSAGFQTPWTPGDMFTPRSAGDATDSHHPPDLVPSSPGPSPEPPSGPGTPTVQINFEFTGGKGKSTNEHASGLFDPIPFAPYHSEVDSKYSSGKFALISPPLTDITTPSSSPLSEEGQSWRKRYESATDPRLGVVRQLIGVKRKLEAVANTHARPRASSTPSWLQQCEDWSSDPNAMDVDTNDDDDGQSDMDSDDDSLQPDSELESPALSRPATPPPSYLPPGPSLLHHKFDHTQLLPISTPSRPPGSSSSASHVRDREPSAGPIPSVPTPVSPAAMPGATSEKVKMLQEVAIAVAQESVENPLWAEAWDTVNRTSTLSKRNQAPMNIWPDDLRVGAELLGKMKAAEGPLDLTRLFNLQPSNKPLQPLEQPHISVGKGQAIIQVLPSALRFADKLGLGPKNGTKDLDVYTIFEEGDEHRRSRVDSWLSTVSSAYSTRSFGAFRRGKSASASNGLFPARLDSNFRKTLSSLLSNLPPSNHPTLVLLIIPVSLMTLSSPSLRHIISSTKKAAQSHPTRQLVFHLVPEPLLLFMEESHKSHDTLNLLCSSLYDRIPVTVSRRLNGHLYAPGPGHRSFPAYSFTLSRPPVNKVTYSRSTRPSLDVLDRYTFLHVGYKLSPCKKWLLASCLDQRGEYCRTAVWLVPPQDEEAEESVEAFVADKVVGFGMNIALQANVEWRIVISKLGRVSIPEMEAWDSSIAHVLDDWKHPTALHIYLVSSQPDAPWTLLDFKGLSSHPPTSNSSSLKHPRSSNISHKHNATNVIYTDSSWVVYAIYPRSRLTVPFPPPPSLFSGYQIPEPPSRLDSSVNSNPASNRNSHSLEDSNNPHSSNPSPSPSQNHTQASPQKERCDNANLPTLPQSSTTLIITTPSPSTDTPPHMVHIHLLKSFHSVSSNSPHPTDEETHRELTRNFFELGVLSCARRVGGSQSGFGGPVAGAEIGATNPNANPMLPYHLAAVDSMWRCLDVDWEQLEDPNSEV
ncbi:hypothetical protein CC2G_010861 [Coprinopsis cinerea AmutBmut pab1-1]|nr:hypothetical protein CC2G_010861 [Coprinopsis cinerea AmutBmut pab1-1]